MNGNILLKFCRRSNNYSQKIIAGRLGVSLSQYRAIERGERLVNFSQAQKLAKAFNCPTAYIFTSALQLDDLLTNKALIKILQNRVDYLEENYTDPISKVELNEKKHTRRKSHNGKITIGKKKRQGQSNPR